MAKKINFTRRISYLYHKVWIEVQDENCLFSIKPYMKYQKVFKSISINTAVKAAAIYCNRYMKEYAGVIFKYSTDNIVPYNYFEARFAKEED
jgi:hypothetical protein